MKQADIKPGARIEATRDLVYARGAGQPHGVHKAGAHGLITRIVRGEPAWTSVDIMFDGCDTPYRCDLKAAEFCLRLVDGTSAHRRALHLHQEGSNE